MRASSGLGGANGPVARAVIRCRAHRANYQSEEQVEQAVHVRGHLDCDVYVFSQLLRPPSHVVIRQRESFGGSRGTCLMAQKIVVILKGYPRLSETFIAQELLGLEKAGHELNLVSLRHPTDAKRHPVHDEIRAPVNYLPEYLHQEPGRVLIAIAMQLGRAGFWRALREFWRDFRRDRTRNRLRRFGQACVLVRDCPRDAACLYAHFIHTPASVTRYASIMSGLPWMCSAHAKDIWTSPSWDLSEKLASAKWVATCTAVGRDRLAELAMDPERVRLIYHGLDLDRFADAPQRQDGGRDGQDTNNPVRLISVGRAVPKKGFDTLIEALALLPRDLAWKWEHIGGGAQLNALKSQANAAGLSDRIDWRGAQAQSDVLAAYRSSDVFILPCRIADDGDRDGLPNVIVEAQSQGLACISTPVSAIPELVRSGENGLLVPPDDSGALAGAITQLCRDPDLRARFGEAGRLRVRREFDYRAGIARLDGLFRHGRDQHEPIIEAQQNVLETRAGNGP